MALDNSHDWEAVENKLNVVNKLNAACKMIGICPETSYWEDRTQPIKGEIFQDEIEAHKTTELLVSIKTE